MEKARGYMDFTTVCCTDVGTRKNVNQDSACAMTAVLDGEQVCMLLLCDGMGGISMGEYASRYVILNFADWFEKALPELAGCDRFMQKVEKVWVESLIRMDEELRAYGAARGIKLGTTATCMFFWRDNYLLIQSGDSRAYVIGRRTCQLSEDQSFVQQQINLGRITPKDAKHHPKRNILTDCIGGTSASMPVVSRGRICDNVNYLLCSDGLVHELSDRNLQHYLTPGRGADTERMRKKMVRMVNKAKHRGERDNITAVVLMVRKAGKRQRLPDMEGFREDQGEAFRILSKTILTEDYPITERMDM